MPGAPVIHIGGWPGAGKRTIGRIVANRMSGRLIDNHIMLDAARAIYARGTEGSLQLREEVRAVIMSHARKLPADVPVVLTDAVAKEPVSDVMMQHTLDLACDRAAQLHIFVLGVSLEENLDRLCHPARCGGAKLTDPAVLKSLRQTQQLYQPESAIYLDVTELSAAEAADAICAYIEASDG